jgi:hypothetical protein
VEKRNLLPPCALDRRGFLKGSLGTALGVSLGGLGAHYNPVFASELRRRRRQVLLIWLAGGSSQFETWDPKPGRLTGGPFGSIPTTVPGVHISELLPRVARRLHHMALVRSLSTGNGDHGGGAVIVQTGRRPEAGLQYPDIGTVIARELASRESKVPDYVSLYLATEGQHWGRPDPGFLGPSYSAMALERSLRPEDIDLPDGLSQKEHDTREHLRRYLSEVFDRERRAPLVQGYNSTFARVRGLMQCDSLFDLEHEPAHVRGAYGDTDFGQHALIGRRLLEAGVPMVKVARAWWDSHSENFESHRELVSELDSVLSVLLDDLKARGLLDSTLVVLLSEFGRTPNINRDMGRDHFANAWSCALAGAGIRGGSVHGSTDEDGREVKDGVVSAGDLAATIYQAIGIDPHKEYHVGERPVPLVDEHARAVETILL